MFNMILKLSHYLSVWRKSWIFVGFIKTAGLNINYIKVVMFSSNIVKSSPTPQFKILSISNFAMNSCWNIVNINNLPIIV